MPNTDLAGTTLRLTHGATSSYDVVENWHREVHFGKFEHCDEQPCNAVATKDDR